jgi:hypothetical protein
MEGEREREEKRKEMCATSIKTTDARDKPRYTVYHHQNTYEYN